MVDLRLLRRMGLVLALLWSGCTHTAGISGQLFDERSGQPVAGAEVMIMGSLAPIVPSIPGEGFAYHWATTDAEGRFAIPSHWDREPRPFSPYHRVLPGAVLWIYHPELGCFIEFPPEETSEWGALRIEIAADRVSQLGIGSPDGACDNLSEEGYQHCCEVVTNGRTCTTVLTPRVAARLVDKRTREPIAGATVMIERGLLPFRFGDPKSFGERWTTTDAEGRFQFPEHTDEPPVDGRVRSNPAVWVYHPDYGHPTNAVLSRDPSQWGDDVIAIEPDSYSMKAIRDRKAGRRGD